MPFFHWPTDRTTRTTEEQAIDMILHCTRPEQDAEFAEKHGMTPARVRNYRIGRSGWKLRQKLNTGWRPSE